MDQTLLAAAWKGDVEKLHKFSYEKNREALDQMCLVPFAQTPLHIAALAGKTDFVKAALELMPDFAWLRDQNGLSPIHIASAKGHVDIVKVLLSFDLNQCLLTDNEGRTPLHYAVCKGKVDVIDEFFSCCPQSLEEVTAQDETVLHLAVKAGQFDALRRLLEMLKECGKAEMLLDAKNKEGKTTSDIAAAKKHLQVQHLLKKYNVQTVEEAQVDIDIEEEDDQVAHKIDNNKQEDHNEEKADKSKRSSPKTDMELRNLLLVAAVLIFTVTYQAGLAPPSYIWKEGTKLDVKCLFKGKNKGISLHSPTFQDCPAQKYYWFMILNTTGFFTSVVCMLSLLMGRNLRLTLALLAVSTLTVFYTYLILLASISPDVLSFIAVFLGPLLMMGVMTLINFVIGSMVTKNNMPEEDSKNCKLKALPRIVFRTFRRK